MMFILKSHKALFMFNHCNFSSLIFNGSAD